MGRRGPAPLPTRLKLLRGNPGRRPLNDREPQPEKARPECPDWLDDEAKACWDDLVPQLEAMGVLTRIEGQALTAYCDTWSRWKRAVLFIREHGEILPIKDDKGKVKYLQQMPQVAIARSLIQVLHRYQQEFGMTPSSRTRITANAKPPADKIDELKAALQKARAQ